MTVRVNDPEFIKTVYRTFIKYFQAKEGLLFEETTKCNNTWSKFLEGHSIARSLVIMITNRSALLNN